MDLYKKYILITSQASILLSEFKIISNILSPKIYMSLIIDGSWIFICLKYTAQVNQVCLVDKVTSIN